MALALPEGPSRPLTPDERLRLEQLCRQAESRARWAFLDAGLVALPLSLIHPLTLIGLEEAFKAGGPAPLGLLFPLSWLSLTVLITAILVLTRLHRVVELNRGLAHGAVHAIPGVLRKTRSGRLVDTATHTLQAPGTPPAGPGMAWIIPGWYVVTWEPRR